MAASGLVWMRRRGRTASGLTVPRRRCGFALPPRPHLPPAGLHGFLDAHFASPENLASVLALAMVLHREHAELDAFPDHLKGQRPPQHKERQVPR